MDLTIEQKKEKIREKRLFAYFKITAAEWQKVLDFQQGLCYICQQPQKSSKRLATDHSHKEPAILRGLLCNRCNRVLGKIEDPRWKWTTYELGRLILYLNNPPAIQALGKTVIVFAGKLGTKRHRKHLKKEAKLGKKNL